MQRLFLFLFFAALFVAPFVVRAQDITGVWEGHFVSDNGGKPSTTLDDRYRFEVQIAQHNKSFEAVTYSYLSNIFYGKAAAAGTINIHTGKVLLQEGKLLEVRNQFEGVCIMTCFLQYFKYGGEEFLEGNYVSMALKDSSNCGRGKVLLRKVPASIFYEEPFVLKRGKGGSKEEAAAKSGLNPPKENPQANENGFRLPETGAARKPRRQRFTGSNAEINWKPVKDSSGRKIAETRPRRKAPSTPKPPAKGTWPTPSPPRPPKCSPRSGQGRHAGKHRRMIDSSAMMSGNKFSAPRSRRSTAGPGPTAGRPLR